uniref:gamma-glutamyltransferase family protein n=1 Tax=Qipengyuania sp. TaxID=2004515 RepID=UPI0035C7D1E6
VGVPGNIELAWEAHKRFGKLPWPVLFGPAIDLARKGFAINERMFTSLTNSGEFIADNPAAKAWLFQPDGSPKPLGELAKNEELAQTLEAVARGGPDAFYQGELAKSLAQTVAAATPRPGAMTPQDVASYEAKPRDAVCGSYRGYRLCGMGPPTSGGIAVLQILGMLERFDLAAMGPKNPEVWHLFTEAQRLAYADRELYAADADFVPVPVAGLLDKSYLAKRSAMISPEKSLVTVEAGSPAGARAAFADGDEPEEHGTTHFAAVDRDGTMVSYTSTIESAFGSGLMAGGFFLNNELTDFSRNPSVDGKMVANRVEGGKRPRSSMAPFVVWDPEGRPVLAIGAAGGATIPVQTARSIIGFIDFGLSPEDALGLPFLMAYGNQVMVEKGTWLEAAMDRFRALGHTQIVAREAPVKAGAVGMVDGQWQSARDPRLQGSVDAP